MEKENILFHLFEPFSNNSEYPNECIFENNEKTSTKLEEGNIFDINENNEKSNSWVI
jgi:hypothetical protein